MLKSVKVKFFSAGESCSSGTVKSRTVEEQNNSGHTNIFNIFAEHIASQERCVRVCVCEGDAQPPCYLEESEGCHPAGPALLVLRTQQPQLLHLPSTFIGLFVTIEMDTLIITEP